MTEENKNSNHYSSADIQKYLEGKLSPVEMHAMERAALDDPFLADAMEGMLNNFQSKHAESFNNDVDELNKRLQERISRKEKVIAIPPKLLWPSIAAAMVILIGVSAAIYHYVITDHEKSKTVAIRKENPIVDSAIAKNNSAPVALANDSAIADDLKVNKKTKPEDLAVNKPEKKMPKQKAVDKNIAAKEKEIASSGNRDADIVKVEPSQGKTAITIKADSLHADSSKKQMAANLQPAEALEGKVAGLNIQPGRQVYKNFVQGIVVDNNKQPLMGATVMLKNKKIATSTDANGLFRLNTNNKDTITNVVVNYVGFQSVASALNNNNASANVIQLQPSNLSLSEVVVVGYGTAKKRDNDSDDEADKDTNETQNENKPVFDALPIVGWPSYNNYINQNKKITTGDSTKKGKEIISFIVDTANNFASFKIKKSLSPAHDAEAIRLIKQGPQWKLLKRKKAKVTLAIEF